MNTPTKITVVRILITPLMLFFYLADFIPYGIGKLIACILLTLGVFSDFLDGYLARKNNQVTDLGKFLDPIADKLLATTAITLLIVGANPVIPTVIGVIFSFFNLQRDFMITGFRQIGQIKGIIVPSDKLGKMKAVYLYGTLIFGMLYAYLRGFAFANDTFNIICMVIIYVFMGMACLYMLISEIGYVVKNPDVLRERKAEDKDSKNENIEEEETKDVVSEDKVEKEQSQDETIEEK